MAPTTPKTPKDGPKRKRFVLTLPKKIELVQRLEKGESRSKLMAEYGVSSSTLYDLKKQKDKLLAFVGSTDGPSVAVDKRKSLKGAKMDELDRALFIWFSARRSEGKPLSGPLLCEKAKKLHQDLGIQEPCNFSDGWLRNFKRRHGIRKLTACGEKKSADVDAARKYCCDFLNLIEEHEVTPEQVYNADETALWWRCIPTTTLAAFYEKEAPGFKVNKDRLTALVCANVSGSHKTKLFVIGKFKKPRAFKNVAHLPVHYEATQNAWMTAAIFKWWFFHCFVPEVKEHLKQQGLPEDSKVILILDNCRAHPPASELVSGNIFVVYLPPNVTSLIQPMDQGVIRNFKHHYRTSFTRKLISTDVNVPQFQKEFTIKDAVFAAALAWQDVTPSTVRNCWKKLWPLGSVEDDDDFGGFEEDVELAASHINKLKVLFSHASSNHPFRNVTDEEIAEWLEIDQEEPIVEELTDEAIVASLRSPVREEEEEEEEPPTEKVSWKEAQECLETFVKFVEASSYYNTTDVMNAHIQYNTFLTKKASSCKQKDLRHMFALAAKRSAGPSLSPSPSPTPATPTPTPLPPADDDDDEMATLSPEETATPSAEETTTPSPQPGCSGASRTLAFDEC